MLQFQLNKQRKSEKIKKSQIRIRIYNSNIKYDNLINFETLPALLNQSRSQNHKAYPSLV